MEMATLGKTGLRVSRLGLGLAEIRKLADPEEAGRVLNLALDGGITFLDTAACYGNSEEWIGRTIASRRHEYILATKAGHVVDGYEGEPWSRETILDSVDRSLGRMQTDHVDLIQLHSCSTEVLQRGDAIQALLEAQEAGKARFIGYSGDGEPARWAVESNRFDTLQTSFSIVDQEALDLLARADAKGMGIIIKRPIANGAWFKDGPAVRGTYAETAEAMARVGPIPGAPEDPILLSLGFTLAHPEVDTAIVGTLDPNHMRSNLELLARLPIPTHVVDELHHRYHEVSR